MQSISKMENLYQFPSFLTFEERCDSVGAIVGILGVLKSFLGEAFSLESSLPYVKFRSAPISRVKVLGSSHDRCYS